MYPLILGIHLMKQKQLTNTVDENALELILCKISSAVCETERLNDNFNELKKRYLKALRELNVANEVNRLLKKEIGNLADNQRWLASQLGVDFDESCKDATRLSFCPGFEDILYMNKDELFTYDNKEYDDKYGPEYRAPLSVPPKGGGGKSPRQSSPPRGD